MMKLTRHLFGWSPDARYMDYYERLLFNHRLGTINPEDGTMMYYLPLASGYWKTFGKPFDSLWCCTGTGSEEYAKLTDTIYFHDDDSLYVGIAPAALFESHDQGSTWQLNIGLWSHPHRKQWQPGFGGLCLHTIVTDNKNPKDIKIAISTGGVYQTRDGGKNWRVTNKGVSAYFMPNKYPEFGQCVHKIARHPRKKDLFFLQNHHGVYRSRDGARTWQEIETGLPSNFTVIFDSMPNS